MKIMTSAEIGTRLENGVRRIAPVIAAVYVAGYMFGRWLHRLNDRLAAAYVRLLGLHKPPQAPVPPKRKVVVRATVTRQPLTVEQLIANHTQRELMVMAGTKSKRSKKQLAEKILSKNN